MNLLAFWAPHPGTVLFILNLILQVTLATSVGWLLVALLRRRSALLRYEVQLSVLLFVFFAPLTTWAAEKLLTPQAGLPRTTVQPQALMITDIPSLDAQPGAMNWKGIVLLCVLSLWVAGSIFFFTRFIRGFNTIRQIRRPSRPVRIPRIKEAVEHATEQLGLRKPPKVYTSPRVHAPITLGFFRPMLILPESMAQDQNDKALQGIILHEVAHIARRDLWVGLVHSVVGILYWWHPLVRRLERDLIGLREEICDSYVYKEQGGGTDFARCLLEIAKQACHNPHPQTAAGLVRPLYSFELRIQKLLEKTRNKKTQLSPWSTRGIALFTVLVWSSVIACTLSLDTESRAIETRMRARHNAIAVRPGSASSAGHVAIILGGDTDAWEFGKIDDSNAFVPLQEGLGGENDRGNYRLAFRSRHTGKLFAMDSPYVSVQGSVGHEDGTHRRVALILDADKDTNPEFVAIVLVKDLADGMAPIHLLIK